MEPQVPNRLVRPAQRPIPGSASAALSVLEPETPNLLEDYVRSLKRHRGRVLLCAGIGLAASLLYGLTTVPVYRTRTSLDIRSVNSNFLEGRSSAPTEGGSVPADSDINLQTQIKLLQSDSLLLEVTDRLLAEPHPKSIEKGDRLSIILRSMHLGHLETIPYKQLVNDTAQRIKVKPLGLTRLVEISCDSEDAKFSATFCNALTVTFDQQDLRARATEAQKTSEWLTRQAADIRVKAEEGQKKLEAAIGNNGLLLSQTPAGTGEDRLRSLQEELVKSEADRMAKEAQVSVARSAAPETVASVQDDPAYRAYELKLADLRTRVAALVPPLTEANPQVIHLRSEIAEVEKGMRESQMASTSREQNELAAARHREQLLRMTYSAQASTVSSDLQKTAQVSLLKREVESEQQLYQTLIQRAKEAGFASAMQAATIRVVDPATVPRLPISPRPKLAGAVGLALGALFGFGSAIYKDRHHRVFRAPGEVQRFVHLRELGTIPMAQRGSSRSRAANTMVRLSGTDTSSFKNPAISLSRWNDHYSLVAEAYRSVTFSMLLEHSARAGHSYVVASPNSGEGKTTVTSNLGVALGKSKLRVGLIDGDMRRPSLHEAFGLENEFGLRNILRGEVNFDSTPTADLIQTTNVPLVSVITAGRGEGDVDELLHSANFERLLQRLADDFDVILIDTPPMLHMADARILANKTSGVILVFRAGQTTRDEAATARDLFDHDGVEVVGSILNAFDPSLEGKGHYYKSYYRYQKMSASEGDAEKVA